MQSPQGLKPYKTIRRASETELVVMKSRFIGRCFPVADASEAGEALERIKKLHWDASHNCYAYRVGFDGTGARSSDDGEPSGTAGAPILNVLNRLELVNTLCVVTRYFGGVLLGAGGLTRAYSNAASAATEAAGIVHMRPATGYRAVIAYPQWALVEPSLQKSADVAEIVYEEAVAVTFWLFDGEAAQVLEQIRDRTDGRVVPAVIETAMRPHA